MCGRSGFATVGLALLASMAVSTLANAQPGQDGLRRGSGTFGGRGGFGGPFGTGPLELIRRSEVQKEIDLTDSQIEEVEKLAQVQLEQVRDQFRNLPNLSRDEQRNVIASFQRTRDKRTKEARDRINELLSRSQWSRFAELEFRFHLQRGRIREALAAVGIELDEASRETLQDTEQRVQADVQKRIAQIQQEANTAILAAVMDTETIERLMGDDFIFDAEEPSRRSGSRRTFGGSIRRNRESDDGQFDPDQTPEDRSNRRRRRDRSAREE